MEIITALLGLSFIVFIHELGHAICAKLLGIHVKVFSIGIGRPYFSFQWGETQIRLSPFLLGGYCQMAGSDLADTACEANYDALPEGSFLRAHGLSRALIYMGGPLANVFLAFVIFSIVSFFGFSLPDYSARLVIQEPHSEYFQTGDVILSVAGQPVDYYTDVLKWLPEELSPVHFEVQRGEVRESLTLEISNSFFIQNIRPWIPLKIHQVQDNSPAKLAGLRAGDEILSIDGEQVEHFNQLEEVKAHKGSGEYHLEVKRGEGTVQLSLLTVMSVWGLSFEVPHWRIEKASGVGDAVYQGAIQIADLMKRAFIGTWSLILAPFSLSGQISGPIGIAGQLAIASTRGFMVWLQLVGFINATLAAVNLFFPISVLDGGQILIILVEGVRRKRFKPHTLLRIHTVGAVLVLFLLVLAVLNDLSLFSL